MAAPSWLVLLAAKVAVSAGIVVGVTAAAERLGPRLGGLIVATPQLSVLALIFLTVEQGPSFAAVSAFWNIPGSCTAVAVYLAYLGASLLVPTPRGASIAAGAVAGVAAFVVSAAVMGALPLRPASVMPFAAAVCALTAWLVRTLPDTATLTRVRMSPAVVLARAAISVAVVLTLTSIARAIGPKWAGLLLGFPVNALPVLAILHFHYGAVVMKPFVRAFPAAAFGICLFNFVAWLAVERVGLVATILLGYAVDIAYLALVDALLRRPRRAPRASASGPTG